MAAVILKRPPTANDPPGADSMTGRFEGGGEVGFEVDGVLEPNRAAEQARRDPRGS
jgi:hypothetical protein